MESLGLVPFLRRFIIGNVIFQLLRNSYNFYSCYVIRYKWLDGKFKGTGLKIVVKKCLIDQFLMTPNLLVMFYVGMSLLEGREDVFAELKKKFVPTFTVNLKISV